MNMKTTLGLAALCLLAITVAPTASAVDPMVQGCADPGAGCGPNHNSWVTIAYDVLDITGCISSQIGSFTC